MKPPFEFRSDTRYDVAGFGTNAVDYLIGVHEYPAFNSKVRAYDWQILSGRRGRVDTGCAAAAWDEDRVCGSIWQR